MKKNTGLIIALAVLALAIILGAAFWLMKIRPDIATGLPEASGVYDVDDQPNLKLRIFNHENRLQAVPAKPATQAKPAAPLCNLSDPDSIAVDHPIGWQLPASWTYQLSTTGVPASIGLKNFRAVVAASFKLWTDQDHIKLTSGPDVTGGRVALDGVNRIFFGRTSPGVLGAVYTWYDPTTGDVAEVDTIINNRVNWSWTPYAKTACLNAATYDLQDVLSEEFGHWMGLDDEYDAAYVNNTMYGIGALGEIKKDTLTTGDINGLKLIYP